MWVCLHSNTTYSLKLRNFPTGPFEIRYVLIYMAPDRVCVEQWVLSYRFWYKIVWFGMLVCIQKTQYFSVWEGSGAQVVGAVAVRLRPKWNRKITDLGQNIHISSRQCPYLQRGGLQLFCSSSGGTSRLLTWTLQTLFLHFQFRLQPHVPPPPISHVRSYYHTTIMS